MLVPLDAQLNNADWTKRTWDLPPYKSDEFMSFLVEQRMTLDWFRRLPVYTHAVAAGRIVNDQWAG